MLKWLVQRVPDPSLDVITDDPLATLDFHMDKKRKRLKEIYSVNRYGATCGSSLNRPIRSEQDMQTCRVSRCFGQQK